MSIYSIVFSRPYALLESKLYCSIMEITMSVFIVRIKNELRKKMEKYRGELTGPRKFGNI